MEAWLIRYRRKYQEAGCRVDDSTDRHIIRAARMVFMGIARDSVLMGWSRGRLFRTQIHPMLLKRSIKRWEFQFNRRFGTGRWGRSLDMNRIKRRIANQVGGKWALHWVAPEGSWTTYGEMIERMLPTAEETQRIDSGAIQGP